MLTEIQITDNQLFFERCAKDYRVLAIELIKQLSEHLNIKLDKSNPLASMEKLKRKKQNPEKNQFNGWKFFLHGFHCAFENLQTGQKIEVNLTTPGEFGALDPLFFVQFIKSSPDYNPLPVLLQNEYEDGVRIIEKMVYTGKFELIGQTNGSEVAVIVDRENFNFEWKDKSEDQNIKMKSFFRSKGFYSGLLVFIHLWTLVGFYIMLNIFDVTEINDSLLLQLFFLGLSYLLTRQIMKYLRVDTYSKYIKELDKK